MRDGARTTASTFLRRAARRSSRRPKESCGRLGLTSLAATSFGCATIGAIRHCTTPTSTGML